MTITDTRTVYVEPMVWARKQTGEFHADRFCHRLSNPYSTTAITQRLAEAAGWRRCPVCGKERDE